MKQCGHTHPSRLVCDVQRSETHCHHAKKNGQDYFWHDDGSDILTSAPNELCIDILAWPDNVEHEFNSVEMELDAIGDRLLERGLPFVGLVEFNGSIHRIGNVFPRSKWQMKAAMMLERAKTIDEFVAMLVHLEIEQERHEKDGAS